MNRIIILLLLLLVIPVSTVAAAPIVVAATSWAAAFARAAGAEDVLVIAPENLQHPPDYDPKPSDLLRLRDADFIILGGFEGFAQRLRDASGGNALMVEVQLENRPEVIRREVTRLGELFGTKDKAAQFLDNFDVEHAKLSNMVRKRLADGNTGVVAQKFMSMWAEFAGLELLGTYGPGMLQPGDLLRLSALKPSLVLDNAHMPAGRPVAEATGADIVQLVNFPGPGMDLLDVFRANADSLMRVGQP
jgi:zinc transport system substrate-binding protein